MGKVISKKNFSFQFRSFATSGQVGGGSREVVTFHQCSLLRKENNLASKLFPSAAARSTPTPTRCSVVLIWKNDEPRKVHPGGLLVLHTHTHTHTRALLLQPHHSTEHKKHTLTTHFLPGFFSKPHKKNSSSPLFHGNSLQRNK